MNCEPAERESRWRLRVENGDAMRVASETSCVAFSLRSNDDTSDELDVLLAIGESHSLVFQRNRDLCEFATPIAKLD